MSDLCLEWHPGRHYYCGLPAGHVLDHRAKNDNGYPEPFDVSWPNVCPRCGQPLRRVASVLSEGHVDE